MARDDVTIRIVEKQTVTDTSSVDYLPYGVKILKLLIQRNPLTLPDLGPIWIRPQNYQRPDVDSDQPEKWRVYGTADDDPDLWVAWGAGDEVGFCVKTTEKPPADKVPADLDDNGVYYVYLHLIHRPGAAGPLADKTLTVEAVGEDGEVFGQKVVTLTAPETAVDPARAQWTEKPGDGESAITLAGNQIPEYVSRWWPEQTVTYQPPNDHEQTFLDELTIAYRRRHDGDKGKMDVHWGTSHLAEIGGDLALPLHDYRLVSVEPFRFTDGFHVVLRIWFYWVNLRFTQEELLQFVPPAERDARRPEAQRIIREMASGRFPIHRYQNNDEIPDLERFDLLINPDTRTVSHVGTDTHWQEFWSTVTGETLQAAVAQSFRELARVIITQRIVPRIDAPVLDPLANGLCPIVNDGTDHLCPFRPDGHVVTAKDLLDSVDYAVCTSCGTHFTGRPERAVGIIGKHAPVLKNAKVIRNAVSNNVLKG